MKYSNQIEVIFFSKHSLQDLLQKELLWWLGTTAQLLVGQQQESAQEIYLRTLEETPTIYMS